MKRRQRPRQREHSHVDSVLADGERLAMRPDAPAGMARPRVVLGYDGDAQGPLAIYLSFRAAWAAATRAIGTRKGEQLT